MADRRFLFCTHSCECMNRCKPGCCATQPISLKNPIVVAYQKARARDVVRTCGSTRGKLRCELPDQHDRNAVGRRTHRRGMIEWRDMDKKSLRYYEEQQRRMRRIAIG